MLVWRSSPLCRLQCSPSFRNDRLHFFARFCLLCGLFLAAATCAADPMNKAIDHFLRQQINTGSGQLQIHIGALDQRTPLPSCSDYRPFLPNSGNLLGQFSIGVRCARPNNWTVYVPVRVELIDRYIITAQSLSAGQTITEFDLQEVRGDLGALPAGVILKKEQAIGKTARFGLGAGQALRSEQLSIPILVKQNQSVRIKVNGPGFSASTEGKALNNGGEGQTIQIRTASGSTISGVVQADGSILIPYTK